MTTIAYIYIDPLLESPAESQSWGEEIHQIYKDIGQRNQLEQLLRDCEKRPVKFLLLRGLEDLGDNLGEISERLQQIELKGIKILTIKNTLSGDFTEPVEVKANVAQILAEIEDSQQSRRLRKGHARNRLKALPPPGKAPYGYRRGQERYLLDRSTAGVVKDFFEQFLLYGSLRGAVRYLEKRYGKKISVSTGRRWLTNPVYRGDLVYRTSQIISDAHVAIMSREEAAQIDRLLRRNGRLPRRTASAPRSLAGLVVCQECKSGMSVTSVTGNKQPYLYLRPVNCSKTPKCNMYPYQPVLEMTINRICEDLPVAVETINLQQINAVKGILATEISQKQEILSQIGVLQEQGILDEETGEFRRYKLNTEISQVKAKQAQLPPVNLKSIAQTICFPQFWLDLSESERRFYLREFISKIEIIPCENNSYEIKLIFIF